MEFIQYIAARKHAFPEILGLEGGVFAGKAMATYLNLSRKNGIVSLGECVNGMVRGRLLKDWTAVVMYLWVL